MEVVREMVSVDQVFYSAICLKAKNPSEDFTGLVHLQLASAQMQHRDIER